MSSDPRATARLGERAARRYFRRRGFRIVARNVTCPMGELDLVVLREGQLRFVEVKTRRGVMTHPEDAVNPAKQQRIIRMAEWFLSARRLELPCQFDVLAVTVNTAGRIQLHHFEEAFHSEPGS